MVKLLARSAMLLLFVATVSAAVDIDQSKLSVRSQMDMATSHSGLLFSADEFANQKKTKTSPLSKMEIGKRKSPFKAGVLSFLLPGAGQLYVGERKRATYYLAAEGLIWGSFAAFTAYSDWKNDDARRLGETKAGAQLEGKDGAFFDAVSFYNSVDEYNTLGRIIEPSRPYYLPTDPSTYWRWESTSDRETFKQLKNQSRQATRKAEFMLGAALLNRVVSTIDAVLAARRGSGASGGITMIPNTTLHLDAQPFAQQPVIRVSLRAAIIP